MGLEHDLVGRLPEPLRGEAARYLAVGDDGSLVSLLDDHRAGAQVADPAVLLCVAFARTRWATEVMLDRVVPAAEEALAQVASARSAGAAARDADAVERFVRAALDRERDRQRVEQAREAAAGLTADQWGDRAHRAWRAGRPDEAAALFQNAARQRRVEGRPGDFNDEIRAGLCLAEAGRDQQARPVLEQALTYDWADAGIWNDRHMSEHAAVALLRQAARSGAEEFDRVWQRAVACGQRLSWPFPSIHPIQEELLDLTIGLGLPGHCRHVLDRIRTRRGRLDARTRAKVATAEAYLATAAPER